METQILSYTETSRFNEETVTNFDFQIFIQIQQIMTENTTLSSHSSRQLCSPKSSESRY